MLHAVLSSPGYLFSVFHRLMNATEEAVGRLLRPGNRHGQFTAATQLSVVMAGVGLVEVSAS